MNLLMCNLVLNMNFSPQTSVEMWTQLGGGYQVIVRRVKSINSVRYSHERKAELFRTWSEAYGYFYSCVVAILDEGKKQQPQEERNEMV